MNEKRETVRIDLRLKGDIANQFKAVKKDTGLKWNTSVLKVLIADKYLQKQGILAFCPNCGTRLEKRRFDDVFFESGDPAAVEEDLYCPACCIRWLPEYHSKLLRLLEKPSLS
jgi:hypothetical protein